MKPFFRLFDTKFENAERRSVELLDSAQRIRQRLVGLAQTESLARKFIVVKNDKKIYVVAGPEFVDDKNNPSFYMHRQLRQVALYLLDKDADKAYEIAGGGLITISYANYMDGWFAKWGGQSSDYGPYDPSILAHADEITDWLGLPMVFEWRARYNPSKKR